MKKILFIRHAKSDWSNNSLSDHNRILTKKGEEEALLMAKRLKGKNLFPELFITSSAIRAFMTCKIMKDELNNDLDIIINPKIYHDGINGILESIESVDNNMNFIAIFGHNPTMHNIANQISSNPIYNFPTCSTMLSSSNIEKWKEFNFDTTHFLIHDFPGNNIK